MSSSSSNSSIEVSSYSSSGGVSGVNKRKEPISNSTDSIKKVCKGSGVDSSNKENLSDQTETVTYSNDQESTDMVILDSTDTLNDNDDQEVDDNNDPQTEEVDDNNDPQTGEVDDNNDPQTEEVDDNNDRETSGGSNLQNRMNTVIDSEEFAGRIGSYVNLYLDEVEVTDGLVEQLKGILTTISTNKNFNKQFITKVTSMIKAEVIHRKPSIQNVINCFLTLINSTDLSRKNDERYEVFKQKHNIGSYTEEKSNVNGKEVFKVLHDNQIVYDSKKKERFCLKDSNDIFAIIFFGGHTYMSKFVRSLDDLTDKIVEKLLAALSITKYSSNDNDNNNDNNDNNSNNDNNDIDAAGNDDDQDGNGFADDDASQSDQSGDGSGSSKSLLEFPDEVKEKIFELQMQIDIKGDDGSKFTDVGCTLKPKNLQESLRLQQDWSGSLSYTKMTKKEKEYLDNVKDKDTGKTGEEVWTPYLDHTPIEKVKIYVDYHCCDIYTLLSRFYAKKVEPTCIFIIIGVLPPLTTFKTTITKYTI